MIVEDLLEGETRVLTAGIAVMDQCDVGARSAARERHPQRVEHEIGAHVAGELPADDAAAVDVDDEREEQQAFPATQVGEVGDPERIRARGGELALHEIGASARCGVGDRGPPRLAAPLGALDRIGAHQPPDAVATDRLARPEQRLPGAPVAVGVVVGRMDLTDPLQQPLVLDGPL